MQPMNLQVAFWGMQTVPPMLQSIFKGINIWFQLGPLPSFQIVKMKDTIQQRLFIYNIYYTCFLFIIIKCL